MPAGLGGYKLKQPKIGGGMPTPGGALGPTGGISQPVGGGQTWGGPGGGMVNPGQAAGALTTGPTTYTAQNDPLLMKNVKNLEGRMSADVETAQKQRAAADISTAAESERKKLAGMSARSGGQGALNEMSGDLADKTMRARAGAMTDIGIEGQKRQDALVMGGQGIYAAPGQQNLAERGFLANVDAQKASQALGMGSLNLQGEQLASQNQANAFNQSMQMAQFMNQPGYGGSSGGFGGGYGGYGKGLAGIGRRY